MKGLRFSLVVLFGLSANSHLGIAQSQLPTTEQFMNALGTCATGMKLDVSGDFLGSVRSFYEGAKSQGRMSIYNAPEFLKLFPENERVKAYSLYTECVLKILGPAGEGRSGAERERQRLADEAREREAETERRRQEDRERQRAADEARQRATEAERRLQELRERQRLADEAREREAQAERRRQEQRELELRSRRFGATAVGRVEATKSFRAVTFIDQQSTAQANPKR